MALNLSPSPVYWTPLLYTVFGIGAVFLIYQLFVWKQQNQWITACEQAFGPLDKEQKDGIAKIVRAFMDYGDKDPYKLTYILATARHESYFKPIPERRASASQIIAYNRQNKYWYTGYYGRGYVQLTWQRNYQKMSDFLGVDLVRYPDLALNPKYAAKILVYGMMQGAFTRRKLSEFINGSVVDYYNARKTVNGVDRAEKIADYAQTLFHYFRP